MKNLFLSGLLLLGMMTAASSHTHSDEPKRITLPVPRRELATISPQEFDKLHTAIRPEEGQEPWLAIDWQTDLLKACELAAKESKPVFMWATNGFPLGCT